MDDDRFWVKSLTLENFRCFEKTELGPFDPHFNLLVGANGTGKSSILEALADLFKELAWLGAMVGKPNTLDARDYRAPRGAFMVFSESVAWNFDATFSWLGEDFRGLREFKLRQIQDYPRIWRLNATSDAQEVDQGLQARQFSFRRELLLLYSVRRQFSESNSESHVVQALGARGYAYENWWDAGRAGSSFQDWFKTQTLIALQRDQRIREEGGSSLPSTARPQLELINHAVRKLFPGSTILEFDAAADDVTLRMENGSFQPFRSLSDGQRALLGLIADMVRRACLLNYDEFGDHVLERTTGLVLIDEIDLHLHPKWQRQIVGALKKIFPKIQFFATTHSPQVIGEAQPREVIVLTEDGRQKRPVQSFGMDTNWILECVMEAQGRNPEVAKDVKRLYDAIDDGEFEEARELMAKLREEVGNFGDVEAAESYIWRVEHDADEAAE